MVENSPRSPQENVTTSTSSLNKTAKKAPKRGILYLSTIPPYMTVTRLRELFGQFGTVGRIYLQLEELKPGKKQKKSKHVRKFTEGWVEFERKSVAKKVALQLNNTQVSTRKKSRQYDSIWNIKYLSNFKWPHLNERLAYEAAARKQKLRTEIQLAKKKTNYFTGALDRKKAKKSNKLPKKEAPEVVEQLEVEMEDNKTNRNDFLQSLFT